MHVTLHVAKGMYYYTLDFNCTHLFCVCSVNRQLSKVTTPEYDEVNSVSSTSDLQSPVSSELS